MRNDQDDADYEDEVIRKIKLWHLEEPSVASQVFDFVAAPAVWLAQQVVPQSAVEASLNGLDWLSYVTTSDKSSNNIDDLRQCDRAADRVINWHIGGAAVEGGATGFFGILALPVDIPAIVTIALHVIRQVGIEYGYGENTLDERDFVFGILSVAGSSSQKQKAEALLVLRLILTELQKNTWKALAAKASARRLSVAGGTIAVRELAKQLGVNITKRRALSVVPAIGALVGSAVNAQFIYDVGVAAQRQYQTRWLRDRGRIIDNDLH